MLRIPIALSALLLVVAGAGSASAASEAPRVEWAVSAGGAGQDDADGVGTDSRDRVVVSGGFEGTPEGGVDIFATAYDSSGQVRWTRRYGGPGADQAFDSDVDSRGNALITGSFNDSVDFGTTVLSSRGGSLPRYGDAFLLKLDAMGGISWVRQIGGAGSDGGDEVAIGPSRNAYVIGDTSGPTTFTPSTVLPPGGGRDAWAARYRPDGSLVWARSLGGPGEQQSHGISADRSGRVLVTGEFRGSSIFGSRRLDSAGTAPDVFLAKLDRRGRVLWARRFGDADREIGRGVDADARGNVYFGGEYAGTLELGDITLTSSGGTDSFLARADRDGRIRWAISVGGAGEEIGPEVEVDRAGFSYLTGTFSDAARVGRFTLNTSGVRGGYVAKVSPHGRVRWVLQSEESAFATLGEISLGPSSVSVLGRFVGFLRFGAFGLAAAGETDYFLSRLRR